MTPRFTAKAPDPAEFAGKARTFRCKTVADCDRELAELSGRLSRTEHPKLVADTMADIDALLDRRTVLAFEEMSAEAMRLAREP